MMLQGAARVVGKLVGMVVAVTVFYAVLTWLVWLILGLVA